MRSKLSIIIALLIIGVLMFAFNACADPAIIVYDYELSPEVFMPGDSGILTLTIKNAETTSTVARTTVSGSTTTVTTDMVGATINGVWIDAATSGDKRVYAVLSHGHVGELAPGASFDISFELFADINMSNGLYFPTVHVEVAESGYEDLDFPIPVRISNSSVDLIETEVPSKLSMSGSTEITLTAINRRENSVDEVIITPQEVDGIEFTPKSVFIGTLDSGATEDISFSIFLFIA